MRILVTGSKGQLGHNLAKALQDKYDVVGIDIEELDITDKKNVEQFFLNNNFNIIIHCAAYTNVDQAETDKELCYDINVNGTSFLVEEAKKTNSTFIYFSTDYVFDGSKNKNEYYYESDIVNPINYYGFTKELGEKEVRKHNKHYILRVSWVFGKNGNNFINTMLRLSTQKDELNIIDDQVGSPTYTIDIAKNIEQFLLSDKYGTYHFTNSKYTSWADYARLIFDLANKKVKVNNVKTIDYDTKAERPLNSKLSLDKLKENKFIQLPSWDNAVKRYLKEIGEL